MIFKKYRTLVAEKNYICNQKNSDPDRMINGQNAYSNYRFGLSTLNRVGCGIIAVYNALRMLNCPIVLSELIREFETNSTETVPFGFFGINPFSMKKFFEAHAIPYTKIQCIQELMKFSEEGGIYLLTFWNDAKKLTQGAHTVTLFYTQGRFTVYNRTNNSSQAAEFAAAADIIGNGKLIRGYQLYSNFYEEREE